MANRAILGIGSLILLVLWLFGLVLMIPNIENALADDANRRLPAGSGATVEFNGRDGYLSAPAGADVEQLIKLAAAAPGARDVELDKELSAAAGDAADSAPTAAPSPGRATLDLTFDRNGLRGAGVLGAVGAELDRALGGADIDLVTPTDLSTEQTTVLARVLDVFGKHMASGTIQLIDGRVVVAGTALDHSSGEAAQLALAGLDGLDLDLVVPEPVPAPVDEPEQEDIQTELDDALDTVVLNDLTGVQFETGSAVIRPESDAILDSLAAVLRDAPEVRVEIGGHTDATGASETNLALSEARAIAVADALAVRGVDRERLVTIGYGETQPIAENDTPDGRQANRRVEFTILEEN